MTPAIAELERELDAVCKLYRVSRKDLAYRHKPGRPRETRYLQMIRGVFIVRCTRFLDACPRDLAMVLGVDRRQIGYWRTELLRRGMVKSLIGQVKGVATVVVRRPVRGRAA